MGAATSAINLPCRNQTAPSCLSGKVNKGANTYKGLTHFAERMIDKTSIHQCEDFSRPTEMSPPSANPDLQVAQKGPGGRARRSPARREGALGHAPPRSTGRRNKTAGACEEGKDRHGFPSKHSTFVPAGALGGFLPQPPTVRDELPTHGRERHTRGLCASCVTFQGSLRGTGTASSCAGM